MCYHCCKRRKCSYRANLSIRHSANSNHLPRDLERKEREKKICLTKITTRDRLANKDVKKTLKLKDGWLADAELQMDSLWHMKSPLVKGRLPIRLSNNFGLSAVQRK